MGWEWVRDGTRDPAAGRRGGGKRNQEGRASLPAKTQLLLAPTGCCSAGWTWGCPKTGRWGLGTPHPALLWGASVALLSPTGSAAPLLLSQQHPRVPCQDLSTCPCLLFSPKSNPRCSSSIFQPSSPSCSRAEVYNAEIIASPPFPWQLSGMYLKKKKGPEALRGL